MSTPAAFSRLQLAAALLEYDNDPDNPDAPQRSAQDSAIFAHLRRNPAARPNVTTRGSDYLGVSIPSEYGSVGGRESVLDTRRSRASKSSGDALRNPFGRDTNSEFEEYVEDDDRLEVDLASWGLDSFMPKDKPMSAKAKGKQPATAVGSTRSQQPSTNYDFPATSPRRALITSKSTSLGGNMDDLQRLDMNLQGDRRRSFGSPLELEGIESSGSPIQHRPVTTQSSATVENSTLVPFPTSLAQSSLPGPDDAYNGPKSVSHGRTHSFASMNSRLILDEVNDDTGNRERRFSHDTLGTSKPPVNPFAIQNPSHVSRFDPKSISRARSHSDASMGSRMMLENDNTSVMTGDPYARERLLSTLELLRPKVLVMPSPLQQVSSSMPLKPLGNVRNGFELSADGPPLPPGARSSRRLSFTMSMMGKNTDVPVASNSFTPNPLMDLTLSQKTFRNTLASAGQPIPYDSENALPRATQDGEQVELEPSANEEPSRVESVLEAPKGLRPAGKLYGKSLIDDLESRKAQMRSKQRVFTGDQRPSMMARDQQRSSTLIDPATLQTRPSNQRMTSYDSLNAQQGLTRHPSLSMKPLLNFDGDEDKPLQPPPAASRLPSSRSVFGVDTLWQREMAKLKEMQAHEEKEREDRRIQEEQEELKKERKKDKHKRKGKQKAEPEPAEQVLGSHVPAVPPTLPDIPRAPRRTPPKISDSDISSESCDEQAPLQSTQIEPSWHAGSSDEDEGPRRTTGTGPRYPKPPKISPVAHPADEDSEEDVPLAAAIHKAQVRAGMEHLDSDDEDRPLSHILYRAKPNTTPSKLNQQFFDSSDQIDEDDDQPLGLRASRIPRHTDAEDDMPLGLHPEHQRRTQYQMLAQQQQQQMMMQAQMQSNMIMNASLMGSPYYPPPMMNPMAMMHMQLPMPIPSPPPIQDDAKFGLVDRWRRDVVVEGEKP